MATPLARAHRYRPGAARAASIVARTRLVTETATPFPGSLRGPAGAGSVRDRAKFNRMAGRLKDRAQPNRDRLIRNRPRSRAKRKEAREEAFTAAGRAGQRSICGNLW